MSWIADLKPIAWFEDSSPSPLRAIGWLDREHDYPTGPKLDLVFERLKLLLADPWEPFAACGYHECNLCRHEPEAKGKANLFVPGDGVLYMCPELILHYMNVHEYSPPDEFCRAVLDCPDTRTNDYKRKFLAAGGMAVVRPRPNASSST